MSKQTPHILVVDDDPDFVLAHRASLQQTGFIVSTAANGTEAMVKLREHSIDLVVLDVMMDYPTEGLHVCYEMKEDPALRDIPILMVTSAEELTGQKLNPTDGDLLPADDFVRKPIMPDELVERVQRLLKALGRA